jgi:hypothetical protein
MAGPSMRVPPAAGRQGPRGQCDPCGRRSRCRPGTHSLDLDHAIGIGSDGSGGGPGAGPRSATGLDRSASERWERTVLMRVPLDRHMDQVAVGPDTSTGAAWPEPDRYPPMDKLGQLDPIPLFR